jgi:hypothetical protein
VAAPEGGTDHRWHSEALLLHCGEYTSTAAKTAQLRWLDCGGRMRGTSALRHCLLGFGHVPHFCAGTIFFAGCCFSPWDSSHTCQNRMQGERPPVPWWIDHGYCCWPNFLTCHPWMQPQSTGLGSHLWKAGTVSDIAPGLCACAMNTHASLCWSKPDVNGQHKGSRRECSTQYFQLRC